MSYEGYSQLLCKNGHYWKKDCYEVDYTELKDHKCPVCKKPAIWENMVDITNGSFDDDHDALVLWEGSQRSPVVLAALLWRAVCEATAQEKQDVGIAYYRLRYEQFIDDPLGAVNDILSFCGLRESEKVNAYVGSRQYKNMNYKFWQKLSAGHIQQIERIAGKQMRLVGYGSVI